MNGKKLSTYFNNLSLYKKMLVIVSIAMIFLYAFFSCCLRILTNRYEKELYVANAQSLAHVSKAIEAELQVIESISTNLISDPVVQDNLLYLAESQNGQPQSPKRREIYDGLYPYMFQNRYIQSINLLLADKKNICMGNSDNILEFDTNILEKETAKAEGRPIWRSGFEPGSQVVCARQIRQMKFLKLDKLASLYIIIDLQELIDDALASAGYLPQNSSFILLSEEKHIYPESSFHDELCIDLSNQINASENSYYITTIDGKKEFIIAGKIHSTGWDYLYFRDYDPIFHNIQMVKLTYLVIMLCFTFVTLFLMHVVFRRILRHLDFLVAKIQAFGSDSLPPYTSLEYNYDTRQDEIGQLHRNFDEMTKRVEMLRDENYDKQILLQDATIRMLQQQINPHFLYNTLDTINWMAQKYGADDISVMVRSLGSLFRASITGQGDLIPLTDELSVLDNYVKIQKFRFKERLDFILILPDDISHIRVPKLCIQPLVENALKHAMEYTDETCTIQVTIREREQDYHIKVANTGSQFEENLLWKIEHNEITPQGSGIGLINIDSRLKLLYGNHYGLSFYNKDGMAVVMLSIPKERNSDYVETDDCR